MCYFNPSSAGQVAVEVELLLQLQGLVARVGRSGPFAFRAAYVVCNRKVRGLATHSDWREMVPHSGFDLHFSDNE